MPIFFMFSCHIFMTSRIPGRRIQTQATKYTKDPKVSPHFGCQLSNEICGYPTLVGSGL